MLLTNSERRITGILNTLAVNQKLRGFLCNKKVLSIRIKMILGNPMNT